jgi:hypothetical protein
MINKKYKRSIQVFKIQDDDKPRVLVINTTVVTRLRKQSIICNPKEYDFSEPMIFNVF